MKQTPRVISGLALKFAVTIIVLFAAETGIMGLISLFGMENSPYAAILDSLTLVSVMTPIIYLLFITPIRKYALLHFSEKKYRLLAETMMDGVISTDKDAVITYANSSMAMMLGYANNGEIIGKSLLQFMDEEGKEHARQLKEGAFNLSRHEHQFTARDGNRIYAIVNVTPLLDEGGKYTGAVVAITDITEHKNVEAELKRLNRMLTMLSQCNQLLVKEVVDEETLLQSICLIILDTGGYALAQVAERNSTLHALEIAPRITTARDPAAKPFLTPEIMADCPCNKVIYDNQTILIKNIAQYAEKSRWSEAALRNGCNAAIALPLRFSESVDAVLSIYAEDAGSFNDSEVELLKELAEDLSLGVRTIRDRIKREAAERRVRESELRFRSLTQTANDAIISIDSGGTISFWNDGAIKMFGYGEEEVIGRNITLIIPERYHTLHRAGLARVAAGGPQKVIGTTATLEGVRKGGGEFPLELSLAMWEMEGKKYFTAIIRDVTDRKMVEDALRESHYNLRKVMEDSPVPMALTDENQRIVFLNKKFIWIFGYDLTDIPTVEEWWPRAYPDPPSREAIKAEWNRRVDAVMREGAEFGPMETVVTCKDGYRRDIVFTFSYIGNRGLTVFHDITGRKAMEEKLRMSERSLADAQALAHLGNWEMDLLTGKGMWSDESFRIFGFEPGAFEPTFDTFEKLIHPDDREEVEKRLQGILSGKVSHAELDVRIIRPDGEERVIQDKLEVITGTDGKPVKIAGVNFDITERKKYARKLEVANDELKVALEQVRQTQAVLMRSEKLAAVGTLSAGVAHEILNPLNIISTICQLLLLDERRGKVHESLKEIILQIQRAAKITSSLRMFAREHKMDITAVDLHQLFDHTAKLMEHDLNLDNIFVDRQYDVNAPLIMADADQLAQVFMNLLTNARDVLQPRRGGMITVTTKAAENGIKFSFHDNGPGIPEDAVDRIFDPFFTTKEPGKGTGLGLSVVNRIIEDHGGTIAVESRKGEGTRFTFFLPKEYGPLIKAKKTDKPA